MDNERMNILRILLVTFLFFTGLIAEVSGFIGVIAIVDLMIVPELFPSPGKVLGITAALFLVGNVVFIGVALYSMEWLSSYEMHATGLLSNFGKKRKNTREMI